MRKPVISVIIGSKSDLDKIRPCLDTLKEFKVNYDFNIISAHRQPRRLARFVEDAWLRGIKIFIAAAGGAAALAGVIAAHTTLPVIGLPVKTKSLKGLDSLLSILQMPAGVPVASMAIGKSGAKNAAIFALQVLAINDKKIANKLRTYKRRLSRVVKIKRI